MSGWEWFGVIAAGASVASLPLAIILGWFAKLTAADIHAATQLTLTNMRKGFSESQERLGRSSSAWISAPTSGTGKCSRRSRP